MTDALQVLPVGWVLKVVPGMEVLIRWQMDLHKQVEKVFSDYHVRTEKSEKREEEETTVFSSLLANEELPPVEKSVQRLADEAEIIVAAGTDTTARTICVTVFYVLSDPIILKTLTEELKSAMLDKTTLPAWTELEKLPYLVGDTLSVSGDHCAC